MSRPGDGRPQGAGILSALQATDMADPRPRLPAEILVAVLDYLPVADQMRSARVSRRLREMVYDDTRWVARLKSMGCWDEREARRRFDDSLRRRRRGAAADAAATLFDADDAPPPPLPGDGFEPAAPAAPDSPAPDPDACLGVFQTLRSVRGGARLEYARVYAALDPFYWDVARARSHADPVVFALFRDPERQARVLANLRRFARSDWAAGCADRRQRLDALVAVFEAAVVREFDQGRERWDVDGRMRRYAHVLHTLDAARAAVDLFVHRHPLFDDPALAADPADCLAGHHLALEPARCFLDALLAAVNAQAAVVERIFPDPAAVFWELVDKVADDFVADYATPLLDACHARGADVYLRAASGLLEHTMRLFGALTPPRTAPHQLADRARRLALRVFEPHLDLYLHEELDFFTKHAELEVSQWEKKLSDQDLSLESFYMSNVNRSADKKDFLSSFKKVVMMPVSVLPSFPAAPARSAAGSAAASRASTPLPAGGGGGGGGGRASPLPGAAPTDELAAKAALMASKLAGIKSLCSIEVALTLVHMAKTSLGRAAVVVPLGGQVGGEAREQCANVFVALLRILGQRHVRAGFDTAVGHLAHYSPRDAPGHDQRGGVAPLVTFIELVNVGDLISQMVDVLYEQQLVDAGVADKNDFLDPAGLAKKKFEQMLDESVAAGLHKGIDVLMGEVEYLHATKQPPTDYSPPGDAAEATGPTATARRVVELVSRYTRMLVGTTDKAVLDVFNGEVGQRLFAAICKHLKRQRVSTAGAVTLIADMNLYADYVRGLRNPDLLAYFAALRELSQIFLVDAAHARDLAAVIADADRFGGVFRAEEVYEYAQRRADWYQVRRDVERAMYGMECSVM